MASHVGDELHELEARLDPRLLRALDMVAPGTALREGIDNIIHARTGGLILIAELEDVSFLFSGGIKLGIDYTPALLYQVAKMDGAIVLEPAAETICWANVQLMPDPTILSIETGTRHRTAERVSKQTSALVIAISQRRDVVSLYVEGMKYILQDIPTVLSKANQGLATLEKYRARLDQVSARLTSLEFLGGCTLHDVLSVIQRAELVTRMAAEVERYIIELGTEGRLIEMQLEETAGRRDERSDRACARLQHPRVGGKARANARRARRTAAPGAAGLRLPRRAARLRPQDQHDRLGRSRRAATARCRGSRACRAWSSRRSSTGSATSTPSSTPTRSSSSPSMESGPPVRGRSARVFGPCKRSTSSTDIREPDGRDSRPSRLKEAHIPELATEEATEIEHELVPVECNYEVGDNVVYPHHGAGVVLKKETKDLLGEKRDYLTIKILHNDMTVMVPCENAHRAGLRRVIDGEDVEKVIAVLTGEVSDMPKNWNRRFKHNREKIKTGNVFELAEVVRNLAIREWEKGLSTGEKQMYTRAKKILASEFMYALGKDEEGAEVYLDELLEERFGAAASA